VAALRNQQVRECREARLVDLGRGALGLVEELLALAEAAQLVGAARGDDGGDSLGLVARERRRRALLRRGIAALEERQQGVVERGAQPRALAFLAIGAHARRNSHQRGDHARREVEREIAAHHQQHQHVHRQLDALVHGDDDHVAGGAAREERDADRDRGEDDRPEGHAHG
jgi:hypothetical protein